MHGIGVDRFHDVSLCLNSIYRNSCQANAAFQLIWGRNDAFIVDKTGAGKTTLVGTAALAHSHKVTILIAPLVALRQSISLAFKRSCPSLNVWEWADVAHDLGLQQELRGLLIMGVQQATSTEFLNWLKHNFERVRSIIYDEVHQVALDSSYRQSLLQVYLCRQGRFPCFFLTATLPPSFQRLLASLMQSPNPLFIRSSSTQRHNLRYEVSVCKDNHLN